MKNLKARICSGAMAGVLALSLAVPAFAAGNTPMNTQTEITATYQKVDIKVIVPQTGTALINPYGLDLKVKDAANNEVTISGQKIVTAPMALQNQTAMNLKVGATVTGTVSATSDMRFSTEALAADNTTKMAYVYLQAGSSTLAGNATTVTAAAIATAFAGWEAEAYDAATDVIVSDRGASTENFAVLKAAKMNVTTGEFDEYKNGSIAFVRLAGDCPADPRGGWADTDGFTVNVAYTFAPAQIPTYAVAEGTMTATGTGINAATAMAIKVEGVAVTAAAAGDTVSVDVTVDNQGDAIDWTVVDEQGNAIDGLSGTVAKAANTSRTFTFTMPEKAVKINIVSKAG